jgi:hypothetical protein
MLRGLSNALDHRAVLDRRHLEVAKLRQHERKQATHRLAPIAHVSFQPVQLSVEVA